MPSLAGNNYDKTADQTARQNILDSVDVSDLKWSSLNAVIERLAELQSQGYTGFDVEAGERYGDPCVKLTVTKQRLENDEEYGKRMKQEETWRKREYAQFLALKAKFEDPTKPF
jgi:hypothetical protein